MLIHCQHGMNKSKNNDEDDPLIVEPLPQSVIKKTPDEEWTDDTRMAYASYYYMLGEYLALEKNTNEAQKLFEVANELDPNEFLAVKSVSTKLESGKTEEGLEELRKSVLLYPNSAKLHFLYGTLLSKSNNHASAIQELEKAIELAPREEAPYLQIIAIYQEQSDTTKAIQVCRRLLNKSPQSQSALIILGRLLLEENKIKEAMEPAQKAYQLNNKNAEAVLLYTHLLELNKDIPKAIQIYDQLFSEHPSLEELISKMIALYQSFDDLNEIYERLVTMSQYTKGKSIGIEIQKTLILWELGKSQEALDVLIQLSRTYPKSTQIIYLTALAYEKVGNIDNALAYYQQVDEDSNFFNPAKFQILRLLESQKKYNQAYQVLEQLKNSRYVISEVYLIGANLYAKEEKYSEAIKLLKEGYAKFPDQIQLLFLTGVYQEKMGLIDDCIKSMKTVVRKNPNHSSALNYLGYIWAEQGVKLDLAEKLIRRAIFFKPDDGFYLDSLGIVLAQKGQLADSLTFLTKAAKIEPEEGVIFEHIGDILSRLEKWQEARKSYEAALTKSSLDAKDRTRIEAKLETLKKRKDALASQ